MSSVVLVPKMQNPNLIMKNIRETQIEGHCTKQLTSMLQKHEGHAYKEILYNCFQLKGTKEA